MIWIHRILHHDAHYYLYIIISLTELEQTVVSTNGLQAQQRDEKDAVAVNQSPTDVFHLLV